MTTTRERLERRWTPARVVLLIVGVVVILALVAAGLALWWLPPVLAETPRERFEAPTRVAVRDAAGSAGVEVAAGWVPLGVGPFLSADEATLVSPDGAYRAELGLATLPDPSPTSMAAAATSLLAAHDLTPAAPTSTPAAAESGPSTPGAATPASPTPDAVASVPPPTAPAPAAGGSARWSEETLATGATVRYADVVRGDTTYTVVLLLPPAAAADAGQPTPQQSAVGVPSSGSLLGLTMVVSVRSDDAAAYRTVTADLLASASVFPAQSSSTPSATPPTAIGGPQ
jgi:hypothetical protein